MQTESLWPANTITAALTINHSFGDNDLNVNLVARFERRTLLSIESAAARCISSGGYRALIEPGEFVLAEFSAQDGRCGCCPCFPQLDMNPPPPVLCGTEIYTGGGPPEPDKQIYGEVSIMEIIPKKCRPGYVDPSYYFIDEEGPYFTPFVPATIAVTTVESALPDVKDQEQTIIASGGMFFFDSATFTWVNPEGWVVDIVLLALLGPNFLGNNFTASASFTPPPPEDPQPETDPTEGLEITYETNGVRIAFTGQYAGIAVSTISVGVNNLQTRDFLSPLNLLPARMIVDFVLRTDAPDGPIHSTWSASLPVSGVCPKDYSGSAVIGFGINGEYVVQWS